MALIVRRLLIVLTISSFEFINSNCCDFMAKNEWPDSPDLDELSLLEAIFHKLQLKSKTIPEFKDALKL